MNSVPPYVPPGPGPGRSRRLASGARPMAAGQAVLASFIAVVLVVGAHAFGLLDREGGGGDESSFDFGTASTDTPADDTGADDAGSADEEPPTTDAAPSDSVVVDPGTETTIARADTNAVPTPEDPARVYIAGDSDAGNLGPPLQGILEDTGVVHSTLFYKVSSGLTRPDFFDWPAQLQRDIPEEDPDIVVVTFGGNDAQDVLIDDRSYPVDTPEWKAEYSRRVGAVMDYLSDDGRTLVWVGIPNAESGSFRDRLNILQQVTKDAAAARPDVIYIDTWNIFVGASGGYAAYIIDPRDQQGKLVRADDGFHLNQVGSEILAIEVAEAVTAELVARGAVI